MDPDPLAVPEPNNTELENVKERNLSEPSDKKEGEVGEETMDSTETFYNSELNDLLD